MVDEKGAALYMCRRCRVVFIEYARVPAVLIHGNGVGGLLEDEPCLCRCSAARQYIHAAACVALRQSCAPLLVRPCGAVFQPHVERAVAKGQPAEVGGAAD